MEAAVITKEAPGFVTAFIGESGYKKEALQSTDANSPSATPEVESVSASNISISKDSENIKSVTKETSTSIDVLKQTTSDNGYTITDNAEYGSIEVKFSEKPSEEIRDVLKSNKFRWNGKKKIWYGKTSREAITEALDKVYAVSGMEDILAVDSAVEQHIDDDMVQEQAREYLDDAETFAHEIDTWDKEGRPEGETFILGSTGDVLQGLGAIESDIYMNGDKIETILYTHKEMTLNEIKRIPEILNDPVLVLKSRNVGRENKDNSRVVVFGSVKAQNGQPVLTVLDLKPIENGFRIDDMQKVDSAYTKTETRTKSMAENGRFFVENSDILYLDKKKNHSDCRL